MPAGGVALAVLELLAPVGSEVVAPTVAVFVIDDPAPAGTFSTILNVADAPAASVAIVQVIVPVAPGAGVTHVKAGPVV